MCIRDSEPIAALGLGKHCVQVRVRADDEEHPAQNDHKDPVELQPPIVPPMPGPLLCVRRPGGVEPSERELDMAKYFLQALQPPIPVAQFFVWWRGEGEPCEKE